LAEHSPVKRLVVGSSPTPGAPFPMRAFGALPPGLDESAVASLAPGPVAQWSEQATHNRA
jgi:hypothetical protein